MHKGLLRSAIAATLVATFTCTQVACTQVDSQTHLQRAQAFIQAGDSAAAELELKNALQKEPTLVQARFELGSLYLASGRFDSAEKELDRALELGYPAEDVLPLLAQAYQRSGAQVALSKINYKARGLTSETRAQVVFYKLQALVELDKVEQARKILADIGDMKTESHFKSLALAYRFVLDNQPELALQHLQTLASQHPQEAQIALMQGKLFLQGQQLQQAADAYSRYVNLKPDDNERRFLLAGLWVELKSYESALEHLDPLKPLIPDNPMFNRLLAMSYAGLEQHELAFEHADKAVLGLGSDPALRLVAGFAAYKTQNYADTVKHLTFIADQLPPEHPALKLLAASQLELGQSLEASAILEQIPTLENTDAALVSAAGFQLIRDGDLGAAQRLIESVAGQTLSQVERGKLGILRLSLNDVGGIVDLEQAVTDNGQAPFRATLATAYLQSGRYQQALTLANDWLQLQQGNDSALLLRGIALAKLEQFDQAKVAFEDLAAMDGDQRIAKLALVDLQLLQNLPKGTAALESLLQELPNFTQALLRYYSLKKQAGQAGQGAKKVEIQWQKEPQNIELAHLWARIQLDMGAPAKALETLDSLEPIDQANQVQQQLLGIALLNSRSYERAVQHYQQWLQQSPNEKAAMLGQALVFDGSARFEQGLELVQRFRLLRPDDEQIKALETHFQLMLGHFDEAQDTYESLADGVKSMPMGRGFLARLQAHNGECEASLTNAKAAYTSAKNRRNLLLQLYCLGQLQRQDDAYQLLESYLDTNSTDGAVWLLLAERQLSASTQLAASSYERVIQLQPTNFVALNNLAFLKLESGQLDEAQALAEQAVEIQPQNPDALDTLAQIYKAQQRHSDSAELLSRAVAQENASDEVYLNYVESLALSGQQSLAQRKLGQRSFTGNAAKRAQALALQYQLTL